METSSALTYRQRSLFSRPCTSSVEDGTSVKWLPSLHTFFHGIMCPPFFVLVGGGSAEFRKYMTITLVFSSSGNYRACSCSLEYPFFCGSW